MDSITQGLVLRETQYKENDKILTLLTKDMGKLTAKARGCYKHKSPLAASAQLLVWSEFRLVEQKGHLVVKEGDSIQQFWGVRSDLDKLYLASYFAEVVELVAQEGESHPALLSLILNSLYALDKLNKPLALVKAAFELKLLALVGYEPLVDGCAVCGCDNPVEPRFDVTEGIVHCASCGGGGKELNQSALDTMRHVVYGNPKRMFSHPITQEGLAYLAPICEGFLLAQLGRGFYTLDLYRSIVG